MSTTVTYKGSTLTTAENQTRTLKTAGTYLEGDIFVSDMTPIYTDGNLLEYGNAIPAVVGTAMAGLSKVGGSV